MAVAPSTLSQNTRALWRRRIVRGLVTVVLLAFTLVVIVPFIWMVILSLRTTGGILNDPYGLNPAPVAELHQAAVRPAVPFLPVFSE